MFEKLQQFLYKLNSDPALSYAFSVYTADTPHVYLDIDRTKLESYRIRVSDLFAVLQNNLGSRYVNNITLTGQINKVIIQADYTYRGKVDDVKNMYVRSSTGQMIKIGSFADVRIVMLPKIINRYNQYTDASITASAAASAPERPSGRWKKRPRKFLIRPTTRLPGPASACRKWKRPDWLFS